MTHPVVCTVRIDVWGDVCANEQPCADHPSSLATRLRAKEAALHDNWGSQAPEYGKGLLDAADEAEKMDGEAIATNATLRATELVVNAARHYEAADSFGGFLEQLQKSITLLGNLNDMRGLDLEPQGCVECGVFDATPIHHNETLGWHPYQPPVHPIDRMLGKALTKLSGQAFRYVERAVERGWIGE